MVTLAKRPATIALVNWKPSHRWAMADGADATVNAQIDAMANSIKALGTTKIMLTIYHEPESNICVRRLPELSDHVTQRAPQGRPTDYVNMWHNVRDRFDALGVDNVVWVMNYMGYVDVALPDQGPLAGQRLRRLGDVGPLPQERLAGPRPSNSFYNYLTANSDAEHDFLSKPWGLGEFGYRRQQPDGGVRDVRRGASQLCRTACTRS